MPVIRFVREGRDVPCSPGENLREVALREGIELYGLKGKLGNCGGCGQCITCFVEVVGEPGSLSAATPVEIQRLRRRPDSWRLACQAMVNGSVLVLTRPQTGLADRGARIEQARLEPLPEGPIAWPSAELQDQGATEQEPQDGVPEGGSTASATTDEVSDEPPGGR
jgi:ferredoxin